MSDEIDINEDKQASLGESQAKVVTLGCRLNAYESDVIAANARDAGQGPAVIINTCAVTNDAVAESRRQVRKAARETQVLKSLSRDVPLKLTLPCLPI